MMVAFDVRRDFESRVTSRRTVLHDTYLVFEKNRILTLDSLIAQCVNDSRHFWISYEILFARVRFPGGTDMGLLH